MLNSNKVGQRAKEVFQNGVCCSEAVVYALAEVKEPENALNYMKLSSGFCGGMGVESVCGVVTGGACAIGIFFGRDSLETAPPVKTSTISKQFFTDFQEAFGTIGCRELKNQVPEGIAQRDYCAALVEKGAELAADIINKNK